MTFQYLWAGSWITKALYHLEWNGNDSSGNGINLTNDWTITYSTANGRFWQWVSMALASRIYANNNLWFDGNSDCMFSLWFNIASWTAVWVYNFCGILNLTTSNAFSMYYNTNILYAWKSKRAVQDAPTVATNTIATGVRHNIICVYTHSDKQSYIYIDWLYRTKETVSGNGTWWTVSYFYLWDYSKDKATWAKLDEYFYENRAWTATQIKKYYTMSKWRFWIL